MLTHSVEFSDGTVVFTEGRFVKSRPAGAVSRIKGITDGTSNIIAILIGLFPNLECWDSLQLQDNRNALDYVCGKLAI